MSSYRFGPFVLDVQERRLVRDGNPIPLTPKVFDTLVYLVQRHGRLVGKGEVLEAIWSGSHVEEGSLPRAIHILRKALTGGDGENELHGQYIETVPTKGYRFAVAVTRLDGTSPPHDLLVADVSEPEARQSGGRASRHWALAAACALIMVVLVGSAWRALGQHGTPGLPGLGRLTSQTNSGAAYAKFQSGRFHLDRHLPGDIETSLDDFETAIRLDPSFAAAYAGKADARLFRYWDTGAHDDIAQARVAIRKAIEMDPESSYAHALQCRLLGTYDWDFAGAEAECRRAVDLDPQNQTARRELAFVMSTSGRRDEGLKEMEAAVALAPTSYNKRSRGLLLYFHRLFDEAIVQLRQVEATDPEYVESSRWIARCFEQKHDYEQALQFLVRYRESVGARPEEIASLRRAFATGGWRAVLRASLPDDRPAPNLDTAGTFAQLGEIDAAFETLESMISARRVMVVQMDSEPRLDPLRSDTRFAQLARRVGLRQP
jgi:DNA-binding winged helix-turn-helix (wHTH) protein/thioredoxin-like negative regulator of GroEL